MRRSFICILLSVVCITPYRIAQEYSTDVQRYLEPGEYINSDHPAIIAKAKELISDETDPIKKAKVLYEFVRNEIKEGYIGSMKASDVLAKGEGVCHEKASLLTALARAAGIPEYYGFTVVSIKDWKDENGKVGFIKFLHGANGLYLNNKWILYDPTGNIHRWKIWVQDDPVRIELPLEFSPNHDVLFPTVGKVTVEKTSQKFLDHDINEKIRIGKLYGIDYSKD